jgi:hypothetical protein
MADETIRAEEQVIRTVVNSWIDKPGVRTPLREPGFLNEGNVRIAPSGEDVRIKILTGDLDNPVLYVSGDIPLSRTTVRSVSPSLRRVAVGTPFTYDEQLALNYREVLMYRTQCFLGKATSFLDRTFVNNVLRKRDYDNVRQDQTVAWNYGIPAADVPKHCGIQYEQIVKAKRILRDKSKGNTDMGKRYILIASTSCKESILLSPKFREYQYTGLPTKLEYKGDEGTEEVLHMYSNQTSTDMYFFSDDVFNEQISGKRLLVENIDGAGHPGGYAFLIHDKAFLMSVSQDSSGILQGVPNITSRQSDSGLDLRIFMTAKAGATLIDEDAIVRIAYRHEIPA